VGWGVGDREGWTNGLRPPTFSLSLIAPPAPLALGNREGAGGWRGSGSGSHSEWTRVSGGSGWPAAFARPPGFAVTVAPCVVVIVDCTDGRAWLGRTDKHRGIGSAIVRCAALDAADRTNVYPAASGTTCAALRPGRIAIGRWRRSRTWGGGSGVVFFARSVPVNAPRPRSPSTDSHRSRQPSHPGFALSLSCPSTRPRLACTGAGVGETLPHQFWSRV
jgi:hypothetical protein